MTSATQAPRLTPSARRRLWMAGVPIGAALVAASLPLPEGLPAADHALARLLAVVGAGVVAGTATVLLLATSAGRRRSVGLTVALVALALGAAAALDGARRQQRCTAAYGDEVVLIGTALTPLAARHVAAHPGLTDEDLLLDAAGAADAVWTPASIARCRQTLMATHGWWWPCLVVALLGAGRAIGAGPALAPPVAPHHRTSQPTRSERAPVVRRYDAFISYRHQPPDADTARQLAATLEDEGYRVAIDVRDFAPNAHFLSEMERCVRESRFTLALVSSRYLYSGPCEEEALITRVLDFSDRTRRLIPLYLEPVEAPAWLHGLVGIALHDRDALVEPLARLLAALGPPLERTPTTGPDDAR